MVDTLRPCFFQVNYSFTIVVGQPFWGAESIESELFSIKKTSVSKILVLVTFQKEIKYAKFELIEMMDQVKAPTRST
jgi:hypothetical protein